MMKDYYDVRYDTMVKIQEMSMYVTGTVNIIITSVWIDAWQGPGTRVPTKSGTREDV